MIDVILVLFWVILAGSLIVLPWSKTYTSYQFRRGYNWAAGHMFKYPNDGIDYLLKNRYSTSSSKHYVDGVESAISDYKRVRDVCLAKYCKQECKK